MGYVFVLEWRSEVEVLAWMQLDADTLRCSYINTNTVIKALSLYLFPKRLNPRATASFASSHGAEV
jgi:hypothetical protein